MTDPVSRSLLFANIRSNLTRSGVMLSPHEIESLRRSHAMAPLSPAAVVELLDACAQMARERNEIADVLDDLPESVTALRKALNRLHRLVTE